ncbi:hypothetical protein NFI96_029650, partial [Prochilodus magdalenae]
PDVNIYSYHINSTVNSRYAITVITSRVKNQLPESKEVHFQVKIPKNAFISQFRMTIEGKTYDGVVKEKEEAQQQYSRAVSRGESAGMVSSVGTTLEEFKTSVTVAASSKVTFELTYEELLTRRHGKYQLLIHIQPMQPVADFKMDVSIYESSKISILEVKDGSNKKPDYVTDTQSDKVVWVDFYPPRTQQTRCCGENGLNLDLIITYDVERPKSAGEIKVSDSFFVHYFAPSDIHRIPKNVVFVIDRSGSMSGRKIIQTRLALLKIIADLAEVDHFGLIPFNDQVEVWKPELVKATWSNKISATSFVKQILNAGCKTVLIFDPVPFIMYCESNPTRIQANVKRAIGGRFPFYCLGFGFDVDFDFLEKMALENNGLARRIYEDVDIEQQLVGFYDEVAIPLLTNLQLRYVGATNLTQTEFTRYYSGSEIVVAGQLSDSPGTLQAQTTGTSNKNQLTYRDSVSTRRSSEFYLADTYIKRLWAFLTVKQLLMKEKTLEGQEKEAVRKKALDLSLRFKFVTPLTSLVVVKPRKEDTQVAQKAKEKDSPAEGQSAETLDSSGTPTPFIRPIPPPPVTQENVNIPILLSSSVRFLVSSAGQPKPLCFDLPGHSNYRLLLDPLSGYSMNGELVQDGFQKIVLHFKDDHYLKLSSENVRYYDGRNDLTFLWGEEAEEFDTDSVTLIIRNNEMDVTMGTMRVVFHRHEKDGRVFLWPSVKLQPKANAEGILGKASFGYEELPGSEIRIRSERVKATWSTTTDYRRSSAPVLGCWLVPYQSVLQGELSGFTVSQLSSPAWVTMDRTFGITLLGLLLVCAAAAPTKQGGDVEIYSFHINSTVTSRYAVTVITSRVKNRLTESQEVHFQVKIPKNAFISKFRMTMEGKTYDGVVKKKEEAQQQYSQAVSRGESAGIVSSVGRTLEEFKTSVTVAAASKVTFELTYEELLTRRLGKYQLLINAQPMQPVADFKIDVSINEGPDISLLEVKGGLNTNELANAVTTTRSNNKAWVNFYPTVEQQRKCGGCAESGLNGDLIISYDVERVNPGGELQVSNGFFVHYFSPMDVQRIPKNVVFIIDRSGSMHGRKMHQTRLAMLKILGDLSPDDNFGLITFDGNVDVWKHELLQASQRNLEQAKDFVKKIEDRGATDINAAVLKGVQMINRHPREGSASILILLTDGDPTSGETNIERIQASVKKAIGGKFPLYCLGFGFDVNFDFLEKMALENNGLARRIYEDSDADLQLQGFYEEVATPLLTDVELNYIGAGNLTQTSFSHYYNGSEIVVAGQITDNSLENFKTEVIAISKNSKVKYQDSMSVKDLIGVTAEHEVLQRLWAYLTVKQRLEKEVTLKGEEKEAAKKEALELSLKYNFVTPLTSMVVTKPQAGETQVAHKPKEGEQPPRTAGRFLALPLPPPG